MDNPNNFPEIQTWGTWEELLLACAVHRYGTESWDSVAMELQKRSSTIHLTAQRCKQKYHDLKRRFTQNDTVSDSDVGNNTHSPIPWLDELRKLRVAELKREVERYDLSIVSLQLKVDRLKEEREESSRDNENKPENLDLKKTVPKDAEEENKDKDDGEEKLSLENHAGEPVHGQESDRENQSVNESNWTDPKADNPETRPEVAAKVPEPAEPAPGQQGQTGSAAKPAWEDSFNGSSDTIRKESPSATGTPTNSERVDSERGAGDSPQSRESAADSKGSDEGSKESNSDVQSSASLSKKKGEEPDEPDNEDQSPAIKRVSEESQPLLCFLEIIRSHKVGSAFERRLESQETPYYMDLIRQHADLELVRTRLEEGWYSGCYPKFFRDLLLLFNNAVVFFGRHSSESMAALEFRKLVVKEMALRIPKPEPSLKEGTLAPPASLILKPSPEPDSLAVKPKLSVPLIACRKRSSITGKAASSSSGANNKKERTIALNDEKLTLDWKKHDKSDDRVEEENRVTKKRTRESSAKNSNKNGNSLPNTNINRNSDSKFSTGMSSRAGSHSENLESKAEKEKSNMNAGAKKRSVANFLNRMKSSSSPNNGPLVEKLKSSGMGSDNYKGGAEQKKNVGSKDGSRKDEALLKGSGRKQGKEQGSPAKRSVGRPPKRGAAQPSPRPVVPAKRSRESAETEAGGSRPAKKRSRK